MPGITVGVDGSQDSELLVVGSRGTGGFARLLIGSVTTRVVEHASCSVTVVHGSR